MKDRAGTRKLKVDRALASHSYVTWFLYGYFAQVAMVNFAILEQHYGAELSGRATTAANMLIFLVAFLVQYLFGLLVHLWGKTMGVEHSVIAFQVAFSLVVVLECGALAWYVMSGRRSPTSREE